MGARVFDILWHSDFFCYLSCILVHSILLYFHRELARRLQLFQQFKRGWFRWRFLGDELEDWQLVMIPVGKESGRERTLTSFDIASFVSVRPAFPLKESTTLFASRLSITPDESAPRTLKSTSSRHIAPDLDFFLTYSLIPRYFRRTFLIILSHLVSDSKAGIGCYCS